MDKGSKEIPGGELPPDAAQFFQDISGLVDCKGEKKDLLPSVGKLAKGLALPREANLENFTPSEALMRAFKGALNQALGYRNDLNESRRELRDQGKELTALGKSRDSWFFVSLAAMASTTLLGARILYANHQIETQEAPKKIAEMACANGVKGSFTDSRGRKVAAGRFQDVNERRGPDEVYHRGGFLTPKCDIEDGVLPYQMAGFDPQRRDFVLTDKGELHFQPSNPADVSRLAQAVSLPSSLNVSEACPFVWIMQADNDRELIYEVTNDGKVNQGFIETARALAPFQDSLVVASQCNVDAGKESMPLEDFLKVYPK